MDDQPKILYVEDDETLSFLTRDNLEFAGFQVFHASDGAAAWEIFQNERFDIAVLDIMLPEMDGFSLATKIREQNKDLPIIFLTAKSLKEDKIEGLKIGGDDYITKPFSIEELVLKIKVFLRRRLVETPSESGNVAMGQFVLFPNRYILKHTVSEKEEHLTKRETQLLREFFSHPGEILNRKDLLVKFWGEDDYFKSRSLDVFISRLRKLLKDDEQLQIENVHGVGFRLQKNDPND